jgi:hypothetical protein
VARIRPLRDVALPDTPEDVPLFLRQFQDAVGDAVSVLTEVPLLDFVWKRDVTLAAGVNQIGHGLGRPWRGYIVTRQNAAISVYAPDGHDMRDRLLTLQSTGAGVVDLYVF